MTFIYSRNDMQVSPVWSIHNDLNHPFTSSIHPNKKHPRIKSVREQSLGLYAYYFHRMFNGRTWVLLVKSIYCSLKRQSLIEHTDDCLCHSGVKMVIRTYCWEMEIFISITGRTPPEG